MAKRFLTPLQLVSLDQAPTNPQRGQIYFDTELNTIRAYNGQLWYDVAGPREILDHTHVGAGAVETVQYAHYVEDERILADSGNISSSFIDQIIDGGGASGN